MTHSSFFNFAESLLYQHEEQTPLYLPLDPAGRRHCNLSDLLLALILSKHGLVNIAHTPRFEIRKLSSLSTPIFIFISSFTIGLPCSLALLEKPILVKSIVSQPVSHWKYLFISSSMLPCLYMLLFLFTMPFFVLRSAIVIHELGQTHLVCFTIFKSPCANTVCIVMHIFSWQPSSQTS